MLLTLAALAVFAAVPVLYLTVASRPAAHAEVVANLATGLAVPARRTDAAEGASSLLDRAARAVTPASVRTRLERQLVLVGRAATWPLHRLLLAKVLLAAVLACLSLLYVSASPSGPRLLGAAVTTAVAYFTPELLLHSRSQERQQRIQTELADTLDQMTIAVEAGLGFDTAMARTAHNGTGPLAEELIRTLQDLQVGVPRRTALRALAERTTASDLRRFVTALLQADAYGVPLASVLRTQSAEMRQKRRQRAEERAMQIPVKVVFPLILCILPTLFIVLLGPAVLDMVRAFSA